MMKQSACSIIYECSGSSYGTGNKQGVCCTCGEYGHGVCFSDWVKTTFTNFNNLYQGTIFCRACQFCFCESSNELASIVGKDKPQRMRNYSHFVVNGQWTPLSKGNKAKMKNIILSNPDVAVIATSGQKHIIFRAKIGWWQIEEQSSRPFVNKLADYMTIVEILYRGGFSKSEIGRGQYYHKRIIDFGFDEWRTLDGKLTPVRGSLCLQLAIFLAQKEKNGQVQTSSSPNNACVERDSGGLQKEIRYNNLATDGRQREVGGVHIEPEQVCQRDLF